MIVLSLEGTLGVINSKASIKIDLCQLKKVPRFKVVDIIENLLFFLVGFHYNYPWDFYMIGFLLRGNLAR